MFASLCPITRIDFHVEIFFIPVIITTYSHFAYAMLIHEKSRPYQSAYNMQSAYPISCRQDNGTTWHPNNIQRPAAYCSIPEIEPLEISFIFESYFEISDTILYLCDDRRQRTLSSLWGPEDIASDRLFRIPFRFVKEGAFNIGYIAKCLNCCFISRYRIRGMHSDFRPSQGEWSKMLDRSSFRNNQHSIWSWSFWV